MEEKKLTDEKIVNALKAVGKETLAFAYDKEQRRFEYVTAQEILDFIRRLQEHNGNEVRMRCDMQRKFDDLQNLCIEQKAEIERLKEMCSKSSYRDSWKNKFFKAQEEIERLTNTLEVANSHIDILRREASIAMEWRDKYKKQVDYLNERIQCAEDDCQKVVKDCQRLTVEKEQAVKDTAKEIYEIADETWTGSQNDGVNILVAIKEFCKNKGVEVE